MYDIITNVISIIIVVWILIVLDWFFTFYKIKKYKKIQEYQREERIHSEGKKSGFRKMLDEQMKEAQDQRKKMEEKKNK